MCFLRYVLFNNAVNNIINDRMISEKLIEKCVEGRCHGIIEGTARHLRGLSKITKHPSKDSLFSGRDLNPGPPEY
jgi:hypothetical protein